MVGLYLFLVNTLFGSCLFDVGTSGSGIAFRPMGLWHLYYVCKDYDLFQCFGQCALWIMDITLHYMRLFLYQADRLCSDMPN